MTVEGHDKPAQPAAVFIVAMALMAIGLVMAASTSASLDRPLFTWPLWQTPFGRQTVFVLVGFTVMIVTSRLAVRLLASPEMRRRTSQIAFVITVACLIAALVPSLASPHRGSHRWLRLAIGGMDIGFQPSEAAKLAMVVIVASLLTERGVDPRSFRRCFLPASIAIAVCVVLVGVEDFGTAVLLAGAGAAMLFVAGCRLRHLLVLSAGGACGLMILLHAAPYRLARLTAYRELWEDSQGKAYQPLQSLTTIASGGWLGAGLGSGVQKYGYLPESHTDFIFAVICEELGMLGAVLVIGLFCVLVWLGLRAMLAAPSRFERLVAFGLAATIGLQSAMNIAVVTVVTPTTGISLPLISAGGSSLLTYCLALGVLAAISARGNTMASLSLEADVPGRRVVGMARAEDAAAW